MAAAVGGLVVAALIPTRWMRWVNAVGNRAGMVIAPVKGPVWSLVNWIAPTETPKPEAIRVLEQDRDRWKQLYLHALSDHDDWVRKIEQMYGKGTLYADLPLRQLLRPVVGPSAEAGGQLEIRGGLRDGVALNTVVTTEGVQLVGKVVRVGPRTSYVRLLTDSTAGAIDGRIMTTDKDPGPLCKALYPVGGRMLQGRIRIEGPNPKAPEVGQLVRLVDDRWPRSAQMLVIGAIADPPPRQESTGWYVITVKPTVDLDRLSEVLLRITLPEAEEPLPAPSTDGGKP